MNAAFTRQGTTPVLTINLADRDLTGATVYVTLDQSDVQITKSNYNDNPGIEMTASAAGTTLLVYYSQADTLRLRPGSAKVQIRWIFDDDTADASDIGRLEIKPSLFKGVIAHG